MSEQVSFKKTCSFIIKDEDIPKTSYEILKVFEQAADCIQRAEPTMSRAKALAEAYSRHPHLYKEYVKLAKAEAYERH